MSEQEKLQALVAQMKMIEAYLNDVMTREATITRLLEDGRSAVDAIRNISGTGDVQTLMPIGIGVFMHAAVAPADKLLLSVGSGVAIEKSRDDVVAFIENRMREMEAALRTVFSQKHELEMKMEQSRAEVNALLQQMQKSG